MKKYYLVLLSLFCLGIGNGKAQYTILHNFKKASGASPWGSLTLLRNRFYGVTDAGGINGVGCIFSIDTNGNNYKDLFDLNDTNGANLFGSLTLYRNKFYGMAAFGGVNAYGCIFSIDTNGTGYKDILDFNSSNGANPFGSLTLLGGVLFGMTSYGGANNLGCIFSIDTNGSGYRDLLDFNGSSNGASPDGYLINSGKKMYGITYMGGANNFGCIFSIDTNGNGYIDLYDFDGIGEYPTGSLIRSGKVLYGTTYKGGTYSSGIIFSIDTNGSGFKDLYDFDGANGSYPHGTLIVLGNTLYGMTEGGGLNNEGCIFSIDTNGIGEKDLFDFAITNGTNPELGSLTISGNLLYGMTLSGGTDSAGVIFSFNYLTAGVDNLNANSGGVKLFPDPNNGRFTIESTVIREQSLLEIYNMLGEKIYSSPLPQTSKESLITIDLGTKPSGVYMYRILSGTDGLISGGKLVIQ